MSAGREPHFERAEIALSIGFPVGDTDRQTPGYSSLELDRNPANRHW